VIGPEPKYHRTEAILAAMRGQLITNPDWRMAYVALAVTLGIADPPEDGDPYAWEREEVADYWRKLGSDNAVRDS